MQKKLAKITKASLGILERGILTFWIFVDYEEGLSQGVGGIRLDEWNEETRSSRGTVFGCEIIRRLLLELQVDDFSQMAGKHIWVYGEGGGFEFTPTGISSLYSDNKKSKPIYFEQVLEEVNGWNNVLNAH